MSCAKSTDPTVSDPAAGQPDEASSPHLPASAVRRVIPARVQDELRAAGRTFSAELIAAQKARFAELLGEAGASHVSRDIPYGPDDRQRVDLHAAAPLEAGPLRPMVLYVHGGGFVGGARRDSVPPFYDNVGAWAAGHGWIGATMSYRLAPQHRWPAGAEDVGSAVRKLRERAAEIGGDPDRVVLFGHSAGAAHVAGYLAEQGGPIAPGIAGVVLQSGIYDPLSADEEIAEIVALYYRDARPSTVPALTMLTMPLLLGVGEYDPLIFRRQAALVCPPQVATGHSHFSAVYSLGLDDAYGESVAAFVHDAVGMRKT